MTTLTFDAIGTSWQIDIRDQISTQLLQNWNELIKNRIEFFDQVYSRFRSDSLISTIAKKKGRYTFPPDSDTLFDFYHKLYEMTDGLVTPLVGDTLEDIGYDKKYSLKQKNQIRKPITWDDAMHFSNSSLEVKKSITLDFGAAGKGYLIDIVSQLLKKEGINSFTVDAGGDMRYQDINNKPLRIGLENPLDTTQVIGVANILNQSLCGSAGNRRSWGKFNHIVNPKTLSSPTDILSVWVIANDTMTADGLTTCLYLAKEKTLRSNFQFEYLILFADFSIEKSANFQAELFTI